MPCVLVGSANGTYQFLSINRDFLGEQLDHTSANQYREVGGDLELNVEIDVCATTIEERDKLTDIVGIYLSHPDCKTWFLRHGIRISSAPTVRDAGQLFETSIDYPIYKNSFSMGVVGLWRDETTQDDRLLDIIVEITAMVDL